MRLGSLGGLLEAPLHCHDRGIPASRLYGGPVHSPPSWQLGGSGHCSKRERTNKRPGGYLYLFSACGMWSPSPRLASRAPESDRAKRADCGVIPGNSAKIAARARPCEGGAGTRSTAARAAQIHQCLCCCTMHHVRKLAVIYCNKMGARGHRAWRGQRPSELRAAAFVVAAAAATCCRCCRSEPLLGGTCCRRLLPPLAAAACCRRLLGRQPRMFLIRPRSPAPNGGAPEAPQEAPYARLPGYPGSSIGLSVSPVPVPSMAGSI